MLKRIEQRNQEIWKGHSTILSDATHVIGGIGLGLLLYPVLERRAKSLGWMMTLISSAMHFYADLVKPTEAGSQRDYNAGAGEPLHAPGQSGY
jgi:hypothetical protein